MDFRKSLRDHPRTRGDIAQTVTIHRVTWLNAGSFPLHSVLHSDPSVAFLEVIDDHRVDSEGDGVDGEGPDEGGPEAPPQNDAALGGQRGFEAVHDPFVLAVSIRLRERFYKIDYLS